MWGGTQQFNFQENSGGMSDGAPKEFSFIGQDGGAAAEEAAQYQEEVDTQYPPAPMMQPPHLYAADPMVAGMGAGMGMNPYAYGPPYGPAYGPGGYSGMGALPLPQGSFVGAVFKGAIVGGLLMGAVSFFAGRTKRKRKR